MAGFEPGRLFRRRNLARIHAWVGVVLAIPLALVAVSGTALVFHREIVALRLPELTDSPAPTTAREMARDLDRIEELAAGVGWNLARLPEPDVPYYEVWLMSDERAYLAPGASEFADRFEALSRIESFLYEVHVHLLSGELGESVVAAIGLFAFSLLLFGIYLWYSGPRRLGLAWFLPRNVQRPTMMRAHIAWSAALSVPLLLTVATGVMTAYPDQTFAAIQRISGDHWPARPNIEASFPHEAPRWESILSAADAVDPHDQLVYLFKPAPGQQGPVFFRARARGQWHPNGRSEIYVDASRGEVVHTVDSMAQGTGVIVAHSVFPVHAALGGARFLMPLVVVAGVGLTASTVLGLGSFVARQRREGAKGTA